MPKTIVHALIIKGKRYHIHEERVPEGYQGIIVYEGDFLCYVPLADTPSRFMDEAERQIERVHGGRG